MSAFFHLLSLADARLRKISYEVYAQYAKKTGLTHAQCWAHLRRAVFEAKDVEPKHAAHVLDMIGALYAVEARIREEGLTGMEKHTRRQAQAKP